MWLIATAAASYLLGSIPTGYWIGRSRGVDIRKVGSGNIGATNVLRTLGRGWGLLCLCLDLVKGWIAAGVLAALSYSPQSPWTLIDQQLAHGVMAILGHSYTCFLNFRGGKGVATSAGVLAAIAPAGLIISLMIWIAVVAVTRIVSLGSLIAANLLPVCVLILYKEREGFIRLILICIALALLITYRHRGNIKRLLSGEEPKIRL